MNMQNIPEWYRIENEDELFSPSLIVYPERIEENIRRMTAISGDPARLWPHVKTHKISEIVRLQMKHGITKFKCATIAEAEMVAGCGADKILLAMQPAGPAADRFFRLKHAYPASEITCIADSEDVVRHLDKKGAEYDDTAGIWLDINCGMDRTGIAPGDKAASLVRLIASLPHLRFSGLHAYDGHLHEKNPGIRQQLCDEAFGPVRELTAELVSAGLGPVRIVAGGTPTFPVHAKRKDADLSPGTILLWDWGYSSSYIDLDFLHAAILFARVVSKPGPDLICIDLGHKAVGSEMPQPRVHFPGIRNFTVTGHNEEHMVIRTPEASSFRTGDPVYAIPVHICPTTDRYDRVYVARDKRVSEQWKVDARTRQITY